MTTVQILDAWTRETRSTMPKGKRDVSGYIDETIEYERANNMVAPPGGLAQVSCGCQRVGEGADRVEADEQRLRLVTSGRRDAGAKRER